MARKGAAWRNVVDLLASAAVRELHPPREELDAARQALRQGDVAMASELAERVKSRLDARPARPGRALPAIGSAHSISARARRATGDVAGATAAARRAVAAFLTAEGSEAELDGSELSEWGLALADLGDPEATDVLRRALDAGGALPEAYACLGMEEHRAGNLDSAERLLRDAVAAVPDDPDMNAALGDVLAARGRADEAAHALALAGFERGGRGDLDGAREDLERSRSLVPANAMVLAALAQIHGEQGRLDEARAVAEQARELDPNDSRTHLTYGLVLLDSDDPTGAAEAFEQVLELVPDDALGLAGRARALAALDEWDEAGQLARRAVAAGTDDGFVTAIAASTFEELGDVSEASRLYAAALSLEPDLDLAREGLVALLVEQAEALYDTGARAKAVEIVEQALEVDPAATTALVLLATIHSNAERWTDALDAADRAVACDPDSAMAHVERAVALYGQDQFDEAVSAATRATELDPDEADTWRMLGDLHISADEPDAAAQAFHIAVGLDPDNRAAVLGLASAFDVLDRDPEAADVLTAHVDGHPDDVEALTQLGVALYWSDREDESIRALERSLALDPGQPGRYEARRYIGLGHVARARWTEAVAVLRPLIDEWGDEADASSLASLAFALMVLERHSEAAPLTRRAIEGEPELSYAWGVRARLLNSAGWFDEAIEAARRAVELEPSSPWPYQELAWAMENADDPRAAVAAWADAERMSPDDLWATKGKAVATALAGDRDGAAEPYRHVLASIDQKVTEPGAQDGGALDSDDLALAGWCHLSLGHYPDAVKSLISSVSVTPDQSVQFDLALAMLGTGQTRQALREYRRGIEWLGRVDPLRRRGLLEVAIADIDEIAGRLDGKALEVRTQCRAVLSTELETYRALHPDRVDGPPAEPAAAPGPPATEVAPNGPDTGPDGDGGRGAR